LAALQGGQAGAGDAASGAPLGCPGWRRRRGCDGVLGEPRYNAADAEEGGHGNGFSRRQAWLPRRALHRADEGGATRVWLAGTIPSSTSVGSGCVWIHPRGCSCAHDAPHRSSCAAVATAATATAAGPVGARPGSTRDADPPSVTSAPRADAGRTRNALAAGASAWRLWRPRPLAAASMQI